ncbi:MAG: tRNA (guanosine(37)-N1)-methyltransferase TrmD [Verrucomicrobiota bacterium]|nr:tRNA (guanosine(37)-N1)-methyltransferase TrmD [Verrucomicrobiota bacterium]
MSERLDIDVLTIFPEVVRAPLSESILGRASDEGTVGIRIHDLRDWTTDKYRKVDDEPYGGGPGMVMKPEPFFAAVRDLRKEETRVVLMTPQGSQFDQEMARKFSVSSKHLIILCGHYEGIDHRVVQGLVDQEISIGDYVLTNGALAAAVFIDSIVRLITGVLGDERSPVEESFSVEERILEAPCYTRPADFEGMKVPEVLLSGHHEKIKEWKRKIALERTLENRPDLMP